MMKAKFLLSWPGTYLKEIGICTGIGLALLVANIFWQPAVEPIMPAELTVATPGKPASLSMTEEESLDFIFRPLFSTSRCQSFDVVATENSTDLRWGTTFSTLRC